MNSIDAEDLLSMVLPDAQKPFLIDLARREVWITGAINAGLSRPVARGLRHMSQMSTAPITIFINSEGGDPYESMIIADVMMALNKKNVVVATCVLGISYSAAVIISAAGTPGHRTASPSADFLIHQLSVDGLGGRLEDLEAATKSLKRLNKKISEHLVNFTESSPEEMAVLMGKESYLDAVGAKELGLIDRITIPGIEEGE